jgi:Ca2+-binding EF-hand superfamily protein
MDINPWMWRLPLGTLESSTYNAKNDEMFLAQLRLQRRSSSTSAVEKQAVGRKKPVIDLGAKKTHEEEVLSQTQDSFLPKPPSTPSQMPKNPMRRTLFSDSVKTDMFRSTTGFEKSNFTRLPGTRRAYNTFEVDDPFMANPNPDEKSQTKRSLSSTHTTGDTEKKNARRSRIQSIIAKPSQAETNSPPSSVATGLATGFKQRRGSRGVANVSIELNCPFDITMDAQTVFNLYAKKGSLDYTSFGKIVVHLMNVTKQELSEEGMKKKIETCWREADRNFNEQVEFDEFAIWYSSWGFQQELLLSPQKIRTRDFAKKYDLNYADVDAVYTKFQHFDEDKSGLIEFAEFKKLLYKLMKVPKGGELPENRLNFFWKEIDIDGSGTVCMDEFLQWYAKYFDVKGNSDVTPIEQFYKSVRPNVQQSTIKRATTMF